MSDDLQNLRHQLDIIDKQLIVLLADRFKVTTQVGYYKRDQNLPPVDPAREAVQFERIAKLATEVGLDQEFAARFLRLIIDEVVKNHMRIAAEAKQ